MNGLKKIRCIDLNISSYLSFFQCVVNVKDESTKKSVLYKIVGKVAISW